MQVRVSGTIGHGGGEPVDGAGMSGEGSKEGFVQHIMVDVC